jgi:hypothetical protein
MGETNEKENFIIVDVNDDFNTDGASGVCLL